ncbi:hypothetical protein NVRI1_00702 [Chlamydia abortus]|uniref:hypothetical protein n=1 Tax=Chlamydia abortus TaxID=83555 RepID=UPI0011EFE39F|nr:hypothetical protein [Chlamydia abortus]QEM73525.1 hypothetical protein DZK34_00760 [Chlamydia abortus]CAG9046345.1 hypothetical protein NVRI1_00702 [Chlamydia abortus]
MKNFIFSFLLASGCACGTTMFSDEVQIYEHAHSTTESVEQEIVYVHGHGYYRHKPLPYSG